MASRSRPRAKRGRGRPPVPARARAVPLSVSLRRADRDALRRVADDLEKPVSAIVQDLVRGFLQYLGKFVRGPRGKKLRGLRRALRSPRPKKGR